MAFPTQLLLLALASLLVVTRATESYAGTPIFACEFDPDVNLTLSCADGYLIDVTEAFFGRDDTTTCVYNTDLDTLEESTHCHAPRATQRYSALCNGKPNCTVGRNNQYAGQAVKCSPFINRYLRINYSCQKKLVKAMMCESSGVLPLSCPEGQVIVPLGAFYGRRPNEDDKCPHTDSTVVEVCETPNALNIFEMYCDNKRQCEVIPTNAIFGDACPGVFKYLELNYTCGECLNEHHDDFMCDVWAWQGECDRTPDFMFPFCRRSCGQCQSGPPVCMNYEADWQCDEWASWGECTGNNSAFMNTRCYKSCSGCAALETAECVNEHLNETQCYEWKAMGECEANPPFMLYNCWAACTDECTNVEVINTYGDDIECLRWMSEGECVTNPIWMYQNCQGACLGSTDYACNNVHPNSTECAIWKINGDCEDDLFAEWMWTNCHGACQGCEPKCENAAGESECFDYVNTGELYTNPGWMFQNCWKSCSGCKPDTENIAGDGNCLGWAQNGECSRNPDWMYDNCWGQCSGIQIANNLAVLSDTQDMADAECELYRRWGECQNNSVWMDTNCKKACSQYYTAMDECEDASNQCEGWADANECYWNPSYMLPFCTSICTMCGEQPPPAGFIGQTAHLGENSDLTYQMTMLMPEEIPEDAVLTHFAGFFVNTDEIKLQVWHPIGNNNNNNNFQLIYSTNFSANDAYTAQTIMAPGCWRVQAGDRIGFSAEQNASPIATFEGTSDEPRLIQYRPVASNGPFSQMMGHYYSFGAGYSNTDFNCDVMRK